MTDQKITLKTKAKSFMEWRHIWWTPNSDNIEKIQLVPLSEVEPLELENQQLKKEIEIHKENKKAAANVLSNYYSKNQQLEMQIETAKQILNNELKRSQDELESAKANRKWDIKYWKGRKDSIEKLLLEKEVFGETET